MELILAPPPSPAPQQDPLAFLSSPSPLLAAVKTEPLTPMPTIKPEPESPHFLPYVPVKVEDLDDSSALLASLVAHEDFLRSVSMPANTLIPNMTNSIARFSA